MSTNSLNAVLTRQAQVAEDRPRTSTRLLTGGDRPGVRASRCDGSTDDFGQAAVLRTHGREPLAVHVQRPSQAENQTQSRVDLPQFLETEMSGRVSQALRIYCGGLFGQHPGGAPVDGDLRTEGGGAGRSRRGCNQPGGQGEQVGLDDDGVADPRLLVAACAAGGAQAEDLTTHARSPCPEGL